MERRQVEQLGPNAKEFADLSIHRSWRRVKKGKSSAWTAIHAYITGEVKGRHLGLHFDVVLISSGGLHDEQLLEDLVWTLRKWPLELIDWPTNNSHRLDIRVSPEKLRWAIIRVQQGGLLLEYSITCSGTPAVNADTFGT